MDHLRGQLMDHLMAQPFNEPFNGPWTSHFLTLDNSPNNLAHSERKMVLENI
jgi:hypothetical protein